MHFQEFFLRITIFAFKVYDWQSTARSSRWLEQWQMCTYAWFAGKTDQANSAVPSMVHNICFRSSERINVSTTQ